MHRRPGQVLLWRLRRSQSPRLQTNRQAPQSKTTRGAPSERGPRVLYWYTEAIVGGRYARFVKMVKMRVPVAAVKNKMSAEAPELDPNMLEYVPLYTCSPFAGG